MILRQPALVCFDEVVAEGDDIVDRKLGGGVRLEHCCVVNMLLLLCNSRFDGEKLNVDISHIHSRALNGQTSDVCRLDSELVDKARNLYAGICGQIVDKTAIEHVTADLVGSVGNYSVHNAGGILM